MRTPPPDHLDDERAIVWWPWIVLALGPAAGVLVAVMRSDDSGIFALVMVAALALLFLAAVFAPALIVIARNADVGAIERRRAVVVFTGCVFVAHLGGQVINRQVPEDQESAAWGLALIGVYAAASAIAYVWLRRTLDETTAARPH